MNIRENSRVKLISEILSMFSLGAGLATLFKEYRNKADGRLRYEITITETDPLYHIVQKEALGQIRPTNLHRLRLKTSKSNGLLQPAYFYNDDKNIYFMVNGVKVRFSFVEEEKPKDSLPDYLQDRLSEVKPSKIKLSTGSFGDFETLRDWLTESIERYNAKSRPPVVKTLAPWGSWVTKGPIFERERDSLVLADGQLARILDDVDEFLTARDFYIKKNIPYHRGYLLHGPPGTGKSSLVQLVAKHCKKDLQYLSMSGMKDDNALQEGISSISADSILLIEDIDGYHAATSREEDGSKPTLSGLLNMLDGVLTPDGLLTFVTTNDIDSLDPALIREGRIDITEKLDYADADQMRRLYENFYERMLPSELEPDLPVSPSKIMETFKRNRLDPDQAFKDLSRLCQN